VVVVSDHGFVPVARHVRPGVLLREAGLVTLDQDGRPATWRATVVANAGLAFFYLADPADQASARALEALLRPLAGQPGSGFGRLYGRDEVRARGGDPRLFLAAEAAAGFTFIDGYKGDAHGPAGSRGQHGFDPERADMQAALLIYGGAVARQTIEGARLADVGPTVAGWLGLDLPAKTGRRLAVRLETSASR
jgi:predicted AlkP superfamily pyrophosphatase or phosphodiesterase